jgi:menaquinone-dependent protoporphyrinogen oxidase
MTVESSPSVPAPSLAGAVRFRVFGPCRAGPEQHRIALQPWRLLEGATVKRVLLAYGAAEGQTAKISDVVSEVLRSHDIEATLVDLKSVPDADPAPYDGVVVGASVHLGQHDQHTVDFIRTHADALNGRPTAFFSVSLTVELDPAEAKGYVERFEQETGWRPDRVALFGGALVHTHYGFVRRHLMKRWAEGQKPGLGTDVSRDYVYTEWDAVRRFAEDVAADVNASGTRGP